MDGCIFGWLLFKDIDIPIAHHVGIVLRWDHINVLDSIVVHYGSDGTGKVLLETLYDAVKRSGVNIVKINPYHRATFNEDPYYIDNDGHLHMSNELMQYSIDHQQYDISTSNCQHFVRRFIDGIEIESDVIEHIDPIIGSMMSNIILGSDDDIYNAISTIASSYDRYRSKGICAWDDSLDIYIQQ